MASREERDCALDGEEIKTYNIPAVSTKQLLPTRSKVNLSDICLRYDSAGLSIWGFPLLNAQSHGSFGPSYHAKWKMLLISNIVL